MGPGNAKRRGVLLALASIAATAFGPAAGSAAALPDHDLSPLIATLGLPRADEGATLLPAGVVRWRSSIATASHSVQDAANGESLLFDGETTRVALAVEYGLTDQWQIGIELPYLWHESGGLDNFVETWHDWFGLPNGIRNLVPQDQLSFNYWDENATQLDFQRNRHGAGDVRLLAARQLARNANARTALRMALQLPTGASDKLTGRDGLALSVGIAGDHDTLFESPRWNGFYRASVVALARDGQLSGRSKRLVGVVAGGISARAAARLELTVQGTLRSAAYDSELRLLGDPALSLNVGGHVTLSDTMRLTVAVGEDIRVNSAPDVTIALALQYTPASR